MISVGTLRRGKLCENCGLCMEVLYTIELHLCYG